MPGLGIYVPLAIIYQYTLYFILLVSADIKFRSHHGDACVTMVTPTHHPYVDLISPNFGVALGGNGWAAKSSDEIGRVAADMVIKSQWTYDLPKHKFKLKLADVIIKSKL